MKDNRIIKLILFNSLVILTIIFIFLLIFPKKSYVESKLHQEVSYDETFNNNFNSMKIAAINYFEKNESSKVTLKELKEKDLTTELKDSDGENCDDESYAEKTDSTITINLICKNVTKTTELDSKTYEEKGKNCMYEYEKNSEKKYTDWSDWSEWQETKVEKDELTNVETKTEEIVNGTNEETISIKANENKKIVCPSGYIEENSECRYRTKLNTIKASVSYTCPEGYKKNGTKCSSDTSIIEATKKYYCPTGDKYIEYELSDSECNAYRVSYAEKKQEEIYYTCEEGYRLSGDKCFMTIENEDYKEVTYYRYQKRTIIDEKNDKKISTINDQDLLNQGYNIVREVSCE